MARPKKEKSLHRGKRVYIRFTELEYELVAGYAKDAGYPIGTFVRKQALREKLEVNYNIVADLGEIQNLTVQVAGIGNNLNQIARYFHSGGLASRGMLEELKRCIYSLMDKNKPTAGRTKAIHHRLELSFNLYLLLLFVGQNRASKSLLHITPDFPYLAVFSTNKTFEGQLKP